MIPQKGKKQQKVSICDYVSTQRRSYCFNMRNKSPINLNFIQEFYTRVDMHEVYRP